MEPTCWLIIRLSDATIFGTQFDEPEPGAFDPLLFDVKPWFDTPPLINDDVAGTVAPDPTLSNPDYDAKLEDYLAAIANTGGAKQWYLDNPNAALLFTLTITQLEAEIDALDFSSMPAGTANKLKLLLKTLSISVRVLARREGLI